MSENVDIEKKSTNVQDLLGQIPSWTIRWGSTVILIIVLTILILSWVIKYPEILQGQAVLTTEEPLVKIKTQVNGRIVNIFKENGEKVEKGEALATIQNPLTVESVEYLKIIIPKINNLINDKVQTVEFNDQNYNFGDLQIIYNKLKNTCLDYIQLRTDGISSFQINRLEEKIKSQKQLKQVLEQQISLARKESEVALKLFEIDQKLYENGVLSETSFMSSKTKWLQNQQTFVNLEKSKIQQEVTIQELETSLFEIKFQSKQDIRNTKQSISFNLQELKNAITGWRQNYILEASISGTLTYISKVMLNQNVNMGDDLFGIIPKDQNYIVYIGIPSTGFGRVKVGQTVMLNFNNYPSYEFGSVESKIVSISDVPHQDMYWVDVNLTNGLVTTYGKQLNFKPEMTGTANIVTDDLRLIERVLHGIRKLFERKTQREQELNEG